MSLSFFQNQELNKMDLINKISKFNGKPENWSKWSKTFLAKASLRGYKRIILNQEPYLAEDDMKSWQKLKIQNDLGYVELLLSCQDNVCFNIIDNAKSVKFPEGNLYLSWHMLEQRFDPKALFIVILTGKKVSSNESTQKLQQFQQMYMVTSM
jgi:hypothetical protein